MFPSCKTFIRLCVVVPFLVKKSLTCSGLLVKWIDILFLTHISCKADTSARNQRSRVSLLVLIVSWSRWLFVSAVTKIIWIFSMSAIKFAMENGVSHPSISAKASAARVDLVTRLNLAEFQAIGAELENLSHKNSMYLP